MTSAKTEISRARAAMGGVLLAALLLASGCGTPALHSARGLFYAGRFNAAVKGDDEFELRHPVAQIRIALEGRCCEPPSDARGPVERLGQYYSAGYE